MENEEVVVHNADTLTPKEIVRKLEVARGEGARFVVEGKIRFEFAQGLESQMPLDFPYDDILRAVRAKFARQCVLVTPFIHSWQDPEHEEQQARWCLLVEW